MTVGSGAFGVNFVTQGVYNKNGLAAFRCELGSQAEICAVFYVRFILGCFQLLASRPPGMLVPARKHRRRLVAWWMASACAGLGPLQPPWLLLLENSSHVGLCRFLVKCDNTVCIMECAITRQSDKRSGSFARGRKSHLNSGDLPFATGGPPSPYRRVSPCKEAANP